MKQRAMTNADTELYCAGRLIEIADVRAWFTKYSQPHQGATMPMPTVLDLDAIAEFCNIWLAQEHNRKLLDAIVFGQEIIHWREHETREAFALLNRELPRILHYLTLPDGFNQTDEAIQRLLMLQTSLAEAKPIIDRLRSPSRKKSAIWHSSAVTLARNVRAAVLNAGAKNVGISGASMVAQLVHTILRSMNIIGRGVQEAALGQCLARHSSLIASPNELACDTCRLLARHN